MKAKSFLFAVLAALLAHSSLQQPINANNAAAAAATGVPQIIVVTPPERQAVLGALGTLLAPLLTNIARPIFTNLASGLLNALNRTNDGLNGDPFAQITALPSNSGDFSLYNLNNQDAPIFSAFLVQTAEDRSDHSQELSEAIDSQFDKRPRVVPFGRIRLIPSPSTLGSHLIKYDDPLNSEIQ